MQLRENHSEKLRNGEPGWIQPVRFGGDISNYR